MKKFYILFVFCAIFLFALSFANNVFAANCGGNPSTCVCGDTVTASTTLTGNLTCTGHGLVVGANDITIDGGNYTITGDSGVSDYGINNSGGWDNITIKNFNITHFGTGIWLQSCTGSTIQSITANSNSVYGIYLGSSNTNTLTSNTVNSNTWYGIWLASSSSNTLTSNTISGNTGNLYISGFPTAQYNNSINTTNKVEGKSVYYFYNKVGTASDPFVYDGSVLGNDIGMFWCISCDYVQVKNATLSDNNYAGVYFFSTTNSLIQNITANSSDYGISLFYGSSNTLTSNTVNSNTWYGIYLSSSSNTLTSNTVNSNEWGIYLDPTSNTFTSNVITNNKNDIYNTGSTNTYSSNQFSHNITSKMLTFVEPTRTYSVGDTISFNATALNLDGTACTNCTTAVTYPSETITPDNTWSSTNNPQGHFTATKSGTYSLKFTITDSNLNTTKRSLRFSVGDTNTTNPPTKYYLRRGIPTHGQPKGNRNDSQSLLFTAPTSTETWYCASWIQNSPDELPNYPLSNLSDINIYSWYKQSMVNGAYIGVQRYLSYDSKINYSSSVASVADYTEDNKSFDLSALGGDWIMDYHWNWYWLALKLKGNNPYWQTTVAQPSYANFTYSYTTTPAVKSISNDNANVLSATAPTTDTSNATIVLDYPLSGSASANIVLGDPDNSHPFRRPFQGYTTTINSDGTATLAATGITSTAATINSVPMDITPSTGTITVNINTWETSGYYYKAWTEEGSVNNITSAHTIGNFNPNSVYILSIDGTKQGIYTSNSSGQISFTYSGGYSATKTFEVSSSAYFYQCNNGIDDDGNGLTDYPEDPGCSSLTDNDERSYPIRGGGSSTPTITNNNPLTWNELIVQTDKLRQAIKALQSQINLQTSNLVPSSITSPPSILFTRNINANAINEDVRQLQKFLNNNKFTISNQGPGSLGKETNIFGALTKQALIKFQETYADKILKPLGLNKGTGYFGPSTRSFINSLKK